MLMNAWMLLLRRWLRLLLLLLLIMMLQLLMLLLQIVVVVHKAGLRTNHLCGRQGEEICKKETALSINYFKYLLPALLYIFFICIVGYLHVATC